MSDTIKDKKKKFPNKKRKKSSVRIKDRNKQEQERFKRRIMKKLRRRETGRERLRYAKRVGNKSNHPTSVHGGNTTNHPHAPRQIQKTSHAPHVIEKIESFKGWKKEDLEKLTKRHKPFNKMTDNELANFKGAKWQLARMSNLAKARKVRLANLTKSKVRMIPEIGHKRPMLSKKTAKSIEANPEDWANLKNIQTDVSTEGSAFWSEYRRLIELKPGLLSDTGQYDSDSVVEAMKQEWSTNPLDAVYDIIQRTDNGETLEHIINSLKYGDDYDEF